MGVGGEGRQRAGFVILAEAGVLAEVGILPNTFPEDLFCLRAGTSSLSLPSFGSSS